MNTLPWITNDQIAERICFEGDYPEIVIAVGPSRSGTTSLARLMAEQGVPTWYQPMKAILRNLRHGTERSVIFPADVDKIFIKETLGAYSKNESWFDPIDILIKAGVPTEKIKFVPVLRDPLTTAASAMDKCIFMVGQLEDLETEEGLVDVFLWSYENIVQIQDNAERLGIQTIPHVYETYRDNLPLDVGKVFFKRIGFNFYPARMQGWKAVDSLNEFLILLDEPYIFHNGNDLFTTVKKSSGIQYNGATTERINELLSQEQIARIHAAGVYDIYSRFADKCRNTLGVRLDIKTPHHITPNALDLVVVNNNESPNTLEPFASSIGALLVSKAVYKKALQEATKERNLDEHTLDTGADLLVTIFAEHFLKSGHRVVAENIAIQHDPHTVWKRIQNNTGAKLHFIENILRSQKFGTTHAPPQSDLKMAIVCGLPGTGKTTLANLLSKRFNMVVLPKELSELAIKEASQDPLPSDQIIRSSGYVFMSVLADYYLRKNHSVIMEGVAPKRAIRDMWEVIAAKAGAKTYLIETSCSDEVLHKARLEQRVRDIKIQTLSGLTRSWHEVSYDRYLQLKEMFEAVEGKDLKTDSAQDLNKNINAATRLIGA